MFVGGGLFMVWLETGKPWRAFNVFFRPQTSWMTREAIVALPMFVLGIVAVLFEADGLLRTTLPSPFLPAMFTAILGLIFLYCQLRILNSARALPAWRERRAMAVVGLSGFTEGLGIYLLTTAILGFTAPVMMAAMLVLLIARAAMWRGYLAALASSNAPESTMQALRAMSNTFLAAGHAFPATLIVLAYFLPNMTAGLVGSAGVAATLTGWWFKIILVTGLRTYPRPQSRLRLYVAARAHLFA
jgi:phenylacetyl-CoA:acceptor oxidoreductase subunit 2